MKKIIVWGSGEKAKSFLQNCMDCEILFLVDNDEKNRGGGWRKWGQYSIKSPDDADFSQAEYIVICSQYYKEILIQIEGLKLNISKDNICIYDLSYYKTHRDIQRSNLPMIVKKECIENFEDTLIEKNEIQYIKKTILDDMEKTLRPLSYYEEPNSAFMTMLEDIWRSILQKRDLEIIYQNKYGFKIYLDSGFPISDVIKYDFPGDAYPLAVFIREHISHLKCVFDVGANRGIVTCLLASISEEVHSFEPSLEVSNMARKNIALNGFENVIWNNCGVGNHCGKEQYYDYGFENSGVNSFIEQAYPLEKTEMVQIITLDDYCKAKNIEEIDLLKLDVEGYEPFVIEGSRSLITNRKIHCICLEISPTVHKSSEKDMEMLKRLDDNGYVFYDVHNRRITIEDIINIKIHQDIICICEKG